MNQEKNGVTNKSSFPPLEVAVLLIITCVVSVLVTSILTYRLFDGSSRGDYIAADEEIQEIAKAFHYVVDNYYEEVDKKALMNSAIQGMLSGLGDDYSGLLEQESSANFLATLKGSYQGLGLEVQNASGGIMIVNVYEDSPASEVGIIPGDMLIRIDDLDLNEKLSTDFSSYVREHPDQTYTIGIRRGEEELSYQLKSRMVTIRSVFPQVYERNGKQIGYLGMDIFAYNTYTQFEEEIQKLEAEGIDGLILDLRSNSGGYLSTAKSIISYFLDSSHVIYQTENRQGKEVYHSTGKVTGEYPIVILANGGTASASEVTIGALTEEYGAQLVGTTTYGKGTVQELCDIDSTGDQYKFTTKKWLTPKGNWINESGFTPGYEVQLGLDYLQNPSDETDNQLQKALDILGE